MERKEILEKVVKEVKEIREKIGDGSNKEHLSDMFLSNSFNDDTTTGQLYENLATVWHQLGRFLDVVELEP